MESNFLDDKLFNLFKELKETKNLSNLYWRIIDECESNRLNQIVSGMKYSEVTTIFDRISNSYLSFVRMLKKEYPEYVSLFEHQTYKDCIMKDEKLKEIYLKGK